ncbi:Protein of unknown function [Rhizobium sp. RU35A]|nr:Protein of unknown function [Rhizobium sp. RU35A]
MPGCMTPRLLTVAALCGGLSALVAQAQTEAQTEDESRIAVGTLVCTSPDPEAQAFDAKTPLMCNYSPTGSNDRQSYTARLSRSSMKGTAPDHSVMSWSVLARSGTGVAGLSLAGTYRKPSAEMLPQMPDARGTGLIGGAQGAFILQPLNAQGTAGTDLEPAVDQLILEPAL